MKIYNVKDIDKFFDIISSCKGKVELVTGEGDRINLKSKLSQYIAFTKLFSVNDIPQMEIIATEADDIFKLIQFMQEG